VKVENIERLHDATGRLRWKDLRPETRADLIRFARACEQHVIERAKAIIKIPGECGACDGKGQCEHYPDDGVLEDCPDCEGLGREPLDWSALDAEVAKENET
jgi:hypothetical protein